MKKFYITEQERRQILSQHGLLNEQEIRQGSGTDPYQYKKEGNKFFYAMKKEGDKPDWKQSLILKGVNAISQNIFGGGKVAENQDDLNKLYAQPSVTTNTTTQPTNPLLSSAASTTQQPTAQPTAQDTSLTQGKQELQTNPQSQSQIGVSAPQYTVPQTQTKQLTTPEGQVTDKFGTRPDISGVQNAQTTTQQTKPIEIKDLKALLKQKGYNVGTDENKIGKTTLASIEKALSGK